MNAGRLWLQGRSLYTAASNDLGEDGLEGFEAHARVRDVHRIEQPARVPSRRECFSSVMFPPHRPGPGQARSRLPLLNAGHD
jgi:hypothetical protein